MAREDDLAALNELKRLFSRKVADNPEDLDRYTPQDHELSEIIIRPPRLS
ncbi:hypothetical protein ACFL24_00260 [Patescibacteria group bacterium]